MLSYPILTEHADCTKGCLCFSFEMSFGCRSMNLEADFELGFTELVNRKI